MMVTRSQDLPRADRARVEAQNAVQWLARLARSYADGPPDDTIPLAFDVEARRIVTPEIAHGVRVGLALPQLTFQFEENGRLSPHPLDIDGKSSTEVEAWLLAELLHRHVDRARFAKSLPYAWSRLMSGDEVKYEPQDLADELDRLTRALEEGADLLLEVRQAVSADASSGTLTCWPRYFEVGFATRADGTRVAFQLGDETDSRARYRVRRGEATLIEEIAGATPRAALVANLIEAATRGR